jgi:paraquat-inducible protein B
MSNLAEPPVFAHAATRRSRRVSVIWLIPLIPVAIGA